MLRTYVRGRGVASPTARAQVLCHDPRVSPTVLIVDDHPSFRASARAMLESAGFDVVGEATDGASALDAVESLEPSLVLLDVQLPDMSGFDVCAEICCRNPSPSVIFVSSRDASDYGELVSSSAAAGFVPKDELTGDAVTALLA
jgi:DNA-binding NarL/FixJ family response regulator